MAEYKIVQMKLLHETVERARLLKDLLNARNRTDAVSRAIDIALTVVKAGQAGGSIILESESGAREKLVIPGVTR